MGFFDRVLTAEEAGRQEIARIKEAKECKQKLSQDSQLFSYVERIERDRDNKLWELDQEITRLKEKIEHYELVYSDLKVVLEEFNSKVEVKPND